MNVGSFEAYNLRFSTPLKETPGVNGTQPMQPHLLRAFITSAAALVLICMTSCVAYVDQDQVEPMSQEFRIPNGTISISPQAPDGLRSKAPWYLLVNYKGKINYYYSSIRVTKCRVTSSVQDEVYPKMIKLSLSSHEVRRRGGPFTQTIKKGDGSDFVVVLQIEHGGRRTERFVKDPGAGNEIKIQITLETVGVNGTRKSEHTVIFTARHRKEKIVYNPFLDIT